MELEKGSPHYYFAAGYLVHNNKAAADSESAY
jgi:hypothetical protein